MRTYVWLTLYNEEQLQVHVVCLSDFKQHLLRDYLEKGSDLANLLQMYNPIQT